MLKIPRNLSLKMVAIGPGGPWQILGKPEYLPSGAEGPSPLTEAKAELHLKGELIFAFRVSGKAGHVIGATRQIP